MLARIGEALDSEIVALGAGPDAPAGHRPDHAVRARSTSRPPRTPASRCSAPRCSTAGRTTLRKVARIEEVNRLLEVLDQHRRADPLAQRRQRPRDRPAGRARPGPHRRGRPPAVPARSSCSSARCCTATDVFELPYAGGCDLGTRTVEPHMAALRPFGLEVKATDGQLPRARSTGRSSPTAPDRAHRARRHRHRERPDGRRAAPRHDGDPQRSARTTWSRTSASSCRSSACDVEGIGTTTLTVHRRARDRRRRRLRAVARTRSRRCRCSPPRSSPSPRSPSAGCRSSSSRSSSRCSRRWASATTAPRSTSPRNGHTRLVDITTQHVRAARAPRQDPPDAVPGPQHRQPAVLRGDRRRRRGPDAAARLGLREPRDLPHRAQQARRPGQAARPAPGDDRGPDPLVAAPRSSARRRCARPW